MLFDLFIFLSWPSMWCTGPFTPTQRVSWQLERYMYTLSSSSTHRQTCKVQWGGLSHASYLPSFSYFLSLVYSEHDNTQLVCNKQWYVQCWTFYWCWDNVHVIKLWWVLFHLFIFLSWHYMWWTCGFTPTQEVSWQLEWYMYTLSYISIHKQTLKV